MPAFPAAATVPGAFAGIAAGPPCGTPSPWPRPARMDGTGPGDQARGPGRGSAGRALSSRWRPCPWSAWGRRSTRRCDPAACARARSARELSSTVSDSACAPSSASRAVSACASSSGSMAVFARADHVARVQLRGHIHDGDARLLLAVENGPVDGRRAPVLRQQGRVDVDASRRVACSECPRAGSGHRPPPRSAPGAAPARWPAPCRPASSAAGTRSAPAARAYSFTGETWPAYARGFWAGPAG